MINEDYVSFETAKLLKEKGFNPLECGVYYSITTGKRTTELLTSLIACPTLQMVMKWLREKGFIISPIPDFRFNKLLYTNLIINTNSDPQRLASELYNTYEEACEAGIRYCLKNLI